MPLPIPASIYGLLLMFFALKVGIVPLNAVQGAGDWLVEIMPVSYTHLDVYKRQEIPVSLSAWLALTNTAAQTSADISKRFAGEMAGGRLTGFRPYQDEGEIYFNQRWLMVIGEKK